MPSLVRPDVTGFASTYPSGSEIGWHVHPSHQLVHAISGAMWVSALEKRWILPVGRALWMPAEIEHNVECQGVVEMRTAYLSPAYLGLPDSPTVFSISALARETLVRLADVPSGSFRSSLGEVLVHEVREAQGESFFVRLPADQRLNILTDHLRSEPGSRRTIAEWARTLGYSERSLIRHIRAETGMTFRELRRQIRILVAIEHLAAGQSVTQTGLSVGFETTSAFIEAFRVVTGKTPRQFTRAE